MQDTQTEWVGAVLNHIWQINPSTHKYTQGSSGWANTIAATASNKKIFCVTKGDKIWSVDSNSGEYVQISGLGSGWESCKALVWSGDHLFAFCNGLYKIQINESNGATSGLCQSLTESGWRETTCATALGGYLYVVTKSGRIWRVNPTDGKDEIIAEGFENTVEIVAHEGKLYTFGASIRRVDPAKPSGSEIVSKTCDVLPHAATSCAGSLWTVSSDGKVWKINATDGSKVDTGLTGWETTKFLLPLTVSQKVNINPSGKQEYDVFISHKQTTGGGLAMTLKLLLLEVNPKLRIFLDVDDLNNVHDLEENIANTKNIILLVTEGVFESKYCKLEIQTGLKLKKHFILVHDERSGYKFPAPESVAEEVRPVLTVLAVPWIWQKDFREVSLKNIVSRLI